MPALDTEQHAKGHPVLTVQQSAHLCLFLASYIACLPPFLIACKAPIPPSHCTTQRTLVFSLASCNADLPGAMAQGTPPRVSPNPATVFSGNGNLAGGGGGMPPQSFRRSFDAGQVWHGDARVYTNTGAAQSWQWSECRAAADAATGRTHAHAAADGPPECRRRVSNPQVFQQKPACVRQLCGSAESCLGAQRQRPVMQAKGEGAAARSLSRVLCAGRVLRTAELQAHKMRKLVFRMLSCDEGSRLSCHSVSAVSAESIMGSGKCRRTICVQ
eukprot:scaffold39052_cov22-Tisochrysis_lutea.AAC.1